MSSSIRSFTLVARSIMLAAAALTVASPVLCAQVSLATAVDMAIRNSPRVKSAEADVTKAQAVLNESKDIYIPSLNAGAGIGQAYGYSNYPPTLFNITSTSLIYNAQQTSYIHSARAGLEAAQHAVEDMRETVAEDAANTFLTLDHDQRRAVVLGEESEAAGRLLTIVQERFDAGLDSKMDLLDARLSVANLHVASVHNQEDLANDRMHLARLMGIPPGSLRAEGGIPAIVLNAPEAQSTEGYANASVAAAFANARAKQLQAKGDAHFLYIPQISMLAQFNRYATFTNAWAVITQEANDPHLSPNEEVFGLQITLPLLDRLRRQKAIETAADATKALHDAEFAQVNVLDAQGRLNHNIELLQAEVEVADIEQQRAEEQLEIVRTQTEAPDSAPRPMTPKDVQNSRINEREKFLATLDRRYDLQQAQISLLRQLGHLEAWVAAATSPLPTLKKP